MVQQDPEYLQSRLTNEPDAQGEAMRRYYRFHAMIYDLTRWTFLFGRRKVLTRLPFQNQSAPVILEVGCGTGKNLRMLRRLYPQARLIGMDVSAEMLDKARKTVGPHDPLTELIQKPYTPDDSTLTGQLDAILFSYSLTMINPQWKDLLQKAREDLKPGGVIAAVDFHDSPFQWFKTHMANNHVKMEGHLKPVLESLFSPITNTVKHAYFGIWQYLLFTGRKEASHS